MGRDVFTSLGALSFPSVGLLLADLLWHGTMSHSLKDTWRQCRWVRDKGDRGDQQGNNTSWSRAIFLYQRAMFKPSLFIRTLQSRGYPQRGPHSWVGRIPFNPRVVHDVTEAWRPVSWSFKVNFVVCNEVVLSTSDFPAHFFRPLPPTSSWDLPRLVWISCWKEMMRQVA